MTALVAARPTTQPVRPRAGSRVVVAHDWLVRLGGAERVLDDLLLAFPGSRLLTSVAGPAAATGLFAHAEPTWLQRLPGAVHHHDLLLPLMPLAWRTRRAVIDADVVVTSSYACANAVRTGPGVPLVSYCHTPMRYAWAFDEEKERLPAALRGVARPAMSAFRVWDRATARRVSLFLAKSSAVAERIRRCYGRPARVVHPPVDTEFFTPAPRDRAGFVYVGRLTGYKRPDVVVRAFRDLPYELTVVGVGSLGPALREAAPPNVRFASGLSADELRELYRRSIAMVYPVNEDFGIAMAEAQACGTPVIGLAAGGALDIVEHGRTGWLVRDQDASSIQEAARAAVAGRWSAHAIAASTERFGRERFRRELTAIVDAVASGATEQELT
jgi:glycosyltransferase involved in cell wall biosynthesis